MADRRAASNATSVCCERCFKDPVLIEKIRDEGNRGTCAWCGASRVRVLDIAALTQLFRQLARQYASAASYETGDLLDVLIQEDWEVFADVHNEGRGERRRELMLAILEFGLDPKDDVDEPDYRDLFARRVTSAVDLEGRWDDRVIEVLGELYWVPSGGVGGDPAEPRDGDFDYLTDALAEVGTLYPSDQPLYRARIHVDRSRHTRFSSEEMGAPPPELTPAGRANRRSEPVLYLASDEATALAEVRAWKGAVVAVAHMQLAHPARVLNLVQLPSIGSPFGIEDLTWLLDARALLRRLGIELSRPVIPGEEDRHYLPSQHACDVARRAGYNGIAYPSAMGAAHNVVLFKPTAATATEVVYRRVSQVICQSEELRSMEVRADDWPYD